MNIFIKKGENMKKAALHNLGCKVNAYETEVMQEILEQNGYEIVPFTDKADVYVINTCTVTNMADRKSRQMLHRARKQNPGAIIVAAGCYVQAQENAGNIPEGIDILIGNNKKHELADMIRQYEAEKKMQKAMVDIHHTQEYETMELKHTAEHTRACIKVQDGCNQFCTYCIIPYARGRVRSRKKEDVIREVTALAKAGYKEVVLTGIHLSSYGIDTKEDDLLSLITAIHGIAKITRIRLGSLEPGIITESFVKALSRMEKICPHFHLSLQSGCNATLKRMNRRYTAEEYEEKCQLLRKYFDHPALTTDVIVGFPGETEEEFEESRSFVERISFYETHIFKYSKRAGTKAAVMPDQVPEPVKTARSNVMLELDAQKRQSYEKAWTGKCAQLLIEEEILQDGAAWQVGHTKEYIRAAVKTTQNLQNQELAVRIGQDCQIMR